ncbi:MAG TPA: NAD(+) diphosphatase [Kofleriaceae bacterium]|nr:NAD(+) diphosphatase [Kofleriaceae bacterium]
MAFTPGISSTAAEGRLYVISGQSLCVTYDATGGEPRVPVGPVPRSAIFLGDLDDAPCFARLLAEGEPPPEGTDPIALRQLFGALPDDDFGVAGRALGLTAWDRDHRYCGRCGSPTERSPTERVRTCSRCGHGAYPRLSPAIIALVERDGRALLARNARFPLPFFSTLAGFVEVGESLEAAVAREIHEEAGIAITDVRYFGSQPWPFTGSLMIGFTARWASGEIVCDPREIADADWFLPDELPRIPPKLSIARELIDHFVVRHGGNPRD